jgi:hypothetical protein
MKCAVVGAGSGPASTELTMHAGYSTMTKGNSKSVDTGAQLNKALARWETEGGAGSDGPQDGSTSGRALAEELRPTNAELVQLRIRVIALENLIITLLAEASDRQLNLAREMAEYISPRPGFTPHPLTIHAATHMTDLVERAVQFRVKTPS